MPRKPGVITARKRVSRQRRIVRPKLSVRNLENQSLHTRKVAASKDLTLVNSATSAGSFTLNNQGFTTLTTTAAQQTFYYSMAMGFCLADIPDATQYSLLYDRYRLNKVEVKLYPVNTMSATSNNVVGNPNPGLTWGNGQMGGFVHYAIDYDDRAAPTASDVGIDTLRNRTSYRMVNVARAKPITLSFRPRLAIAAYEASTAFAGYSNMRAQWLDTVSPSDDIEHYGWKAVFEIMNPSSNINYMNYKLEVTYHLEFRDPK